MCQEVLSLRAKQKKIDEGICFIISDTEQFHPISFTTDCRPQPCGLDLQM